MKQITLCLLLAVCGLLVPSAMRAQDAAPAPSIIRLHNGTEITGTVERQPDGSLRVTDQAGDMFVFSPDEVLRITSEDGVGAKSKGETKKGYMGLVELGMGSSTWTGGFAGTVDVVNGYRFSPYFYLGVGVSFRLSTLEKYYPSRYIYTYTSSGLPLYLHMRSSFLGNGRRASPYAAVSFGYDAMGLLEFVWDMSLGSEFRLGKRKSLWAGIGLAGNVWTGGYGLMALDFTGKVGFSF